MSGQDQITYIVVPLAAKHTALGEDTAHSSKSPPVGDQRARAVIRPMRSVITKALDSQEQRLIKYSANSFSFEWYKMLLFYMIAKPILQKPESLKR